MAFNWESEFANTNIDLNAKIYLTVGGSEVFMKDNIVNMSNLLQSRKYPSLIISYSETPEQTHFGVFPTAFTNGIKALFKD
jgi:hypothetical protein